ncbi:CAP domain-containing protein [Allocoleopsis franciscana]|uniref:Cysteine-rich secretory protein family n=1 Tax=Allocoleopsis franciscana PCC 7113 TaxID=1173027 RepID=K9W805_9CYAN|nr:CAP domain-containing protein [Allocoleopsis franciscana]AFZ16520.1 Cysteine-rich secretory protein family [Allocoleopsis franciscana PCC 7113]
MRRVQFWAFAPLTLLATFSSTSWVVASTNLNYTPAELSPKTTILLAQADNLGQAVLDEINQVRSNPSAYADLIERTRNSIRTQEGSSVIDETIQFLRLTPPKPPLTSSRGLTQAARDHVNDQRPKGSIGHDGSDGSNPGTRINRYGSFQTTWGENISYGMNKARSVVMQLLIDDGVPSRGHRKSIVDPDYRVAGVACGSHARYRTMCVIDYAGGYTERDSKSSNLGGYLAKWE